MPFKNVAGCWQSAVKLLHEERRIIEYKEHYAMFSAGQVDNKIKKTDCSAYFTNFGTNLATKATNFNTLIDDLKQIRFVKLNKDQWLLSTCTCTYWHKNLVCKHMMVVAINMLSIRIPALNVPIESNPTRGRKKGSSSNCLTRPEYIEFNNNLFPYPEYNSSLPTTSANAVAEETIAEETIAEDTIVEEPARPKRGRPKKQVEEPARQSEPPAKKPNNNLLKINNKQKK